MFKNWLSLQLQTILYEIMLRDTSRSKIITHAWYPMCFMISLKGQPKGVGVVSHTFVSRPPSRRHLHFLRFFLHPSSFYTWVARHCFLLMMMRWKEEGTIAADLPTPIPLFDWISSLLLLHFLRKGGEKEWSWAVAFGRWIPPSYGKVGIFDHCQ